MPNVDRTIVGVATSVTAFLGRAATGPANDPVMIESFADFERQFGGLGADYPMSYAVRDFYANGGKEALIVRLDSADVVGDRDARTGLYALEKADIFNLLCIPPDTRDGDTSPSVYQAALPYCVERRAMLLVDPPANWSRVRETVATDAAADLPRLGLSDVAARNAAIYFPRLIELDPKDGGKARAFVPCGAVAGVMASTDARRGVWKAPAGREALLNGADGLEIDLVDRENEALNRIGINCMRSFPDQGPVVWGARTLRGGDQSADDDKYVPVRRFALFIEESIDRGTQWVVFEPNEEPLWAQIRRNVGAFMRDLWVRGAFQGSTPRDAYFVQCDAETTTQDDVDRGIVNIVVGFAPLKPAEFVIIRIRHRRPAC